MSKKYNTNHYICNIYNKIIACCLAILTIFCLYACFPNSSSVTTLCGKSYVDGLGDEVDGALNLAKFNRPVWLAFDNTYTLFVLEEYRGVRSVSEAQNLVSSPYRKEGPVSRPRTIDFSLNDSVMYVSNDQWANDGPGITMLARDNEFSKAEVILLTAQTNCVIVNPVDGELLFNRFGDGTIFRFDKEKREAVELLQIDDKASELSFCFSKDGKTLFIVCRNRHYIAKAEYDLETKTLFNVRPFVGKAEAEGNVEGVNGDARFNQPCEAVCDAEGNLFVADSNNHCIRKVTPEGVMTTFAGIPGGAGYLDGPPLEAMFNGPEGLAMDKDGHIYVADTRNHCIRKIAH